MRAVELSNLNLLLQRVTISDHMNLYVAIACRANRSLRDGTVHMKPQEGGIVIVYRGNRFLRDGDIRMKPQVEGIVIASRANSFLRSGDDRMKSQ